MRTVMLIANVCSYECEGCRSGPINVAGFKRNMYSLHVTLLNRLSRTEDFRDPRHDGVVVHTGHGDHLLTPTERVEEEKAP